MDQVAEIREKIDIVSFLQEYLPLKKAGRNFKTQCPFHNEKTPSFFVSPERQIWHCFGCQKGGDVYTFLMEYEHMEFVEALRTLAKRVGVTLQRSQLDSGLSSKKEILYEINALASEFYHYLLTKHSVGKKAMEYLATRKINEGAGKTFHLGFAPRTGNSLSSYLIQKKKYRVEDVLETGLAIRKGRDIVDFFRGRIMFPIVDHRDNVVGFSGRVMDNSISAKYINTRDTLIYHKGETLFGITIAKETMRKENQVYVVEGEFDVIACFQEGILNTLALKGTALTEKQVALLSRFVKKVTLCLDQDSAGQEAIKRSLPLLEAKGLTTTAVVISNGKDPDEAIRNDPFAFKKAIKHDVGIYDYLLDQSTVVHNPKTAEGKQRITEELLPHFVTIHNEVVKEHYLRKLSLTLQTTFESLLREIDKITQHKQTGTAILSPPVRKSREEILEEYLLSLIVQSKTPRQTMEDAVATLAGSISKERAYQKILHILLSYFERRSEFDGKQFVASLPQELVPAFNTSFLLPIPQFTDEKKYGEEVNKVARELRTLYLRKKLKVLGGTIETVEKEGESPQLDKLKEEFSVILSQLESPS